MHNTSRCSEIDKRFPGLIAAIVNAHKVQSEQKPQAVTQTNLAAEGLSIPMVKGTAEAIRDPFYKALALEVNHSGWIGLAMDQLLGRETGRVFNDEALAVAAGIKSPQEAAQAIENSWSQNRI